MVTYSLVYNQKPPLLPSETLPSETIPLDFDHKNIEACIQLGKEDAKKVVNAGEGVVADQILEQFRNEYDRIMQPKRYKSPLLKLEES